MSHYRTKKYNYTTCPSNKSLRRSLVARVPQCTACSFIKNFNSVGNFNFAKMSHHRTKKYNYTTSYFSKTNSHRQFLLVADGLKDCQLNVTRPFGPHSWGNPTLFSKSFPLQNFHASVGFPAFASSSLEYKSKSVCISLPLGTFCPWAVDTLESIHTLKRLSYMEKSSGIFVFRR